MPTPTNQPMVIDVRHVCTDDYINTPADDAVEALQILVRLYPKFDKFLTSMDITIFNAGKSIAIANPVTNTAANAVMLLDLISDIPYDPEDPNHEYNKAARDSIRGLRATTLFQSLDLDKDFLTYFTVLIEILSAVI